MRGKKERKKESESRLGLPPTQERRDIKGPGIAKTNWRANLIQLFEAGYSFCNGSVFSIVESLFDGGW